MENHREQQKRVPPELRHGGCVKERMSREETGYLCVLDWGTKMVQEDATMKVSLPRLADLCR
jgi:hypothetical protein